MIIISLPLMLTGELKENYTKLCTIDIDVSHAPLRECKKAHGKGTVFVLCYEIILIFGLTELKAQVAWKDLKVRADGHCSIPTSGADHFRTYSV